MSFYFALEAVEAFVDEGEKLLPVHLQVVGGHDRFVNFLAQNFLAGGLGEGRIAAFEETTTTRNRLDDALVFQLGVSFGDGIAIEAKLLRQGPNRRQRLAGAQPARGGGVTNLVHQLEIDRLARLEINLQKHNS